MSGLARATWRYWLARHRLGAHQRAHGDLTSRAQAEANLTRAIRATTPPLRTGWRLLGRAELDVVAREALGRLMELCDEADADGRYLNGSTVVYADEVRAVLNPAWAANGYTDSNGRLTDETQASSAVHGHHAVPVHRRPWGRR